MKIAVGPKGDARVEQVVSTLRNQAPQSNFVDWSPGSGPQSGVDVLISLSGVTRADLELLPDLKLIQTFMDGYESVDIAAATELGVWVSYVPAQASGNADSVAEFAVMLLIAAARRLNLATQAMYAGESAPTYLPAVLLGKTVCIVGVGSVGQHIAQRLVGFGVRIQGVDRDPLQAPKQIPTQPLSKLDEALKEADFVIVALRATAENKHTFNEETIAAMKPGAFLINVARGSLVDSAALQEAIRSGHLGGAGLDVTENDPVKPNDPLLSLPQIFVTPHIAGNSDLTVEGTAAYVASVLELFGQGKSFQSLLNKPEKPRLSLSR